VPTALRFEHAPSFGYRLWIGLGGLVAVLAILCLTIAAFVANDRAVLVVLVPIAVVVYLAFHVLRLLARTPRWLVLEPSEVHAKTYAGTDVRLPWSSVESVEEGSPLSWEGRINELKLDGPKGVHLQLTSHFPNFDLVRDEIVTRINAAKVKEITGGSEHSLADERP
jgi:hypothetical protein